MPAKKNSMNIWIRRLACQETSLLQSITGKKKFCHLQKGVQDQHGEHFLQQENDKNQWTNSHQTLGIYLMSLTTSFHRL